MPKEVTHFLVAEKVASILLEEPFWCNLRKYEKELFLGSIFQDVLYFSDSGNELINKLPDSFHGSKGEDTLAFIKEIIVTNDYKDDRYLAFLVGMVSHVFTDSTFHPMVYYNCGNYYDDNGKRRLKSIKSHRIIECLIDLKFASCTKSIRKYQIDSYLTEYTSTLLSKISKDNVDVLLNSYRKFARIRRLYTNPFLIKLIGFIEPFLSSKIKTFTSLAYRNKKKYLSSLDNNQQYRNPVTGIIYNHPLSELFELSVNKTVAYCKKIQNYYYSKDNLVFDEIGPSLETDCINNEVSSMQFFRKEPLF